ncbi:MAG: hypothetical protein WCP19_14055, partial [Chloroflexota bacterium]
KGLPAGEDPKHFVVILPDWDGSITKALNLRDTGKTAAAAVLNSDSSLVGTYQGSDPVSNVLALLKKAA